MKNLYLDETTKDLALTTGKNLRLTVNASEFMSQKIENVLLFFQGEWFLDDEQGIPYLAQNNEDRDDPAKNIFVKNPDLSLVNTILSSAVEEIDGVEEILNFTTQYNNSTRQYNIIYSIKISEGIINGGVSL